MQEICLSVGDVITVGEYTVRVVDVHGDEISFAIEEPGDDHYTSTLDFETSSHLSLTY